MCVCRRFLMDASWLKPAPLALHLSQPYCPTTASCSSAGRKKNIAAAANKREEEGRLGERSGTWPLLLLHSITSPRHIHPSIHTRQMKVPLFFFIDNEYFLVSAPVKVLSAHTYAAVRLRIRSLPAPEPGFTHQRAAVVNSCLTIHGACVGFKRINMFGLVSAAVKKRKKKKSKSLQQCEINV